MNEFFNAYKSYIIRHSRVAEYKITSDKFDAAKLREVADKVDSSIPRTADDDKAIENFVKFSVYLHDIFVTLYNILERDFDNLNLKGEVIAQYLVAALNREYKVIWDKHHAAIDKAPEGSYFLSDMMNFKIKASDGSGRDLDARAAMESNTDCVSLLLNYLRFNLDKTFSSEDSNPKQFAGNILHSIQCSQIAVVLKHSYDDIIYNGGCIRIMDKSRTIMFDYDSHHNLELLLAGDMIFSERRLQSLNKIQKSQKTPRLHKYSTRFRIKKAKVKDGCISLDFSQGNTQEFKLILDDMQAAMDGYYEFLNGDTHLPDIANSTVDEVMAIWSCIQYICLHVLSNVNFDVALYAKEDFTPVPVKIRKDDLIGYVNKLTGIKASKIKAAIEAMEADWSRYNDIWTSMLYPVHEHLLLPIFPILYSSPYNVIDRFLQKGGINLDKRGKLFENFLFENLTDGSSSYPIQCLPAGKYGTNGRMEEIDVLVSMKNAILVADAKCIHYSVEPINYAEAWSRLKEGCEQAVRKAGFVRNNPQFFPQFGDYSHKNIVPFVVTNYPTYTGFSYKGVYIVDYHCFLSYIKFGSITLRRMSETSDSIVAGEFFYHNEDEFSDCFPQYLSENPLKQQLFKKIYIKDLELTPLEDSWKIVSKSAQIANDPQFNIANTPTTSSDN